MKRRLNRRINWDKDMMEIELLDWQNNAHDFDRLCTFVVERLNEWLQSEFKKSVTDIIPMAQLRDGIRRTAEQFTEQNKSLPMFVVMWLREILLRELKRQKLTGNQ